jgi:BRCT domain type II-containing protein
VQARGGAIKHDDPVIGLGEVRFGSLDDQSGGYTRWCHLACWRVPAAVWLALPAGLDAADVEAALLMMQQIVFCGFTALSPAAKAEVVAYVSDSANWAKLTARGEAAAARAAAAAAASHGGASASAGASTSPMDESADSESDTPPPVPDTAAANGPKLSRSQAQASTTGSHHDGHGVQTQNLTPQQQQHSESSGTGTASGTGTVTVAGTTLSSAVVRAAPSPLRVSAASHRDGAAAASSALAVIERGGAFVVPRPGVGGARAGALLGTTFVLTGLFPELGGGLGLDMGKDRAKALIESFGGRVTSAVSGTTTHLLVGREPGASKVGKAQDRGLPLLDLKGLKDTLDGAIATLAAAPAPSITSFSAGYQTKRQHFLGDRDSSGPASMQPPTGSGPLMIDDGDIVAVPPFAPGAAPGSKTKKMRAKKPKSAAAVPKNPKKAPAATKPRAAAAKKPRAASKKKLSAAEPSDSESGGGVPG